MSELGEPTKYKLTIAKLEAARRQLHTAIELWFSDGDAVAVHTLAFASYEIIHNVSKKLNPSRRDLIFDSFVVKDEYRKKWNSLLKTPANFFKHASTDAEASIEFDIRSAEFFMLGGIFGVQLCHEKLNTAELAFFWWTCFAYPDLVTEQGRCSIDQHLTASQLSNLRGVPRREFFEYFLKVHENIRR